MGKGEDLQEQGEPGQVLEGIIRLRSPCGVQVMGRDGKTKDV